MSRSVRLELTAERPGRRATIVVVSLLAAVASVLLFHIDLSAAHDFVLDCVVRDDYPVALTTRWVRYTDPSPSSIWLPSDWHVWESVRAGSLPLWDRLQGGGYSPVVAFQNGVLHPLRLAMAAFPREAAPSVFIVCMIALAFAGMVHFARSFELPAPIVAAAAFVLLPAMASFIQFSGGFLPLAHLPWLAASVRRLDQPRGAATFAAIAAMTLLSGHPLMIATVGLTVALTAIAVAIARRNGRLIGGLIAGGVAACGLAAFALLPLLLSIPDSWSYKTRAAAGMAYRPLPILQWLQVMVGVVVDTAPAQAVSIDQPAFYVFIGGAGVVLAIAGAVALWKRQRWLPLLLLLTGLLAFPGPWMAPLQDARPLGYMKAWYLLPAFAFFLSVAIAAGFARSMQSTATYWRAAGVVLLTLAVGTWTFRFADVVTPHRQYRVDQSRALAFLRSQTAPIRVTGLWGQTHLPNSSRITGIEDVRMAQPVLPLRYVTWWQAVDPAVEKKSYPTMRMTDRLDSALVGDFNIGYVLQSRLPYLWTIYTMPQPERRDTMLSPLLGANAPVVFRSPSLEIRRVPSPLHPRAEIARNVITVESLQRAAALLAQNRDLARTTAVLESTAPIRVPAQAEGNVAVAYPSERRVTMKVATATGGLVVLHDAFARGWSARVDGSDVVVLPVNILSRGVVVGPGEHRIEMSYMAPGFIAGCWIALFTAVVLVGTVFSVSSGSQNRVTRLRDREVS